jgi:hypothetical protein
MPGLALVSFLGSKNFGGIGVIPYGYDLGLVAVLGVGFYLWAVRSGWRTPFISELEKDPQSEPHL